MRIIKEINYVEIQHSTKILIVINSNIYLNIRSSSKCNKYDNFEVSDEHK